MGACGTPEHLPPQMPHYDDQQDFRNSFFFHKCKHCGYEYLGYFCPMCGVRAGRKLYIGHFNKALILVLLGFILGELSVLLYVLTIRP